MERVRGRKLIAGSYPAERHLPSRLARHDILYYPAQRKWSKPNGVQARRLSHRCSNVKLQPTQSDKRHPDGFGLSWKPNSPNTTTKPDPEQNNQQPRELHIQNLGQRSSWTSHNRSRHFLRNLSRSSDCLKRNKNHVLHDSGGVADPST